MAYQNILFDVADGVAMITLNRNDTRNALSWAMADDIADALDHLGDARVLVLTGAGKGFCSGGDMASTVAEGQGFGDMLYDGISQSVNPMMLKLMALDIPVICAINGAAAGAGAPLALAGDFVIAAESAFFFFAFPNVGLSVDAGSSWLVPRLVGRARALELMMLAERLPAAKALEWGMIYKCVADEALADESLALARRLANGPTMSYRLTRKNVWAAQEGGLADALAAEAEAQRVTGNSADCAEAVAAFLGKRTPVFRGE